MMTNVSIGNKSLKKIEMLLASGRRIFTTQDLSMMWEVSDEETLYSNIQYYVRIGKLKRIYKGIYAIEEYDDLELAQKLVVPSYISFYTALSLYGLIFQHYENIHAMALISKSVVAERKTFIYHKLKEVVFSNSLGLVDQGGYLIAGPERAVCDSLYLVPGLAFDSLEGVDTELLMSLAKLYDNRRLEKEVDDLVRNI